MAEVQYRLDGDIAVLTIDNPPVNAIAQPIRAGLVAAIERLEADPAARAALVIGAGGTFVAGADIKEFGKPPQPPALPDALDRVEAATKPLLCALAGNALGGGLEIALACHWRVATATARLGLPEVTLGILPGAGGTQRLPRLIGAEAALDMILSGRPVDGRTALALGLADGLVDGDGLAGALAFLRRLLAEGAPIRRSSARQAGPAAPDLFERVIERNARKWRGLKAPFKIVEAVRQATRSSFRDGLAFERQAFLDCVASPESQAQRHLFFAERTAQKIPGLGEAKARPVRAAAVIGAGTMGVGIAMSLANAGLPVALIEANEDALVRGLARIEAHYRSAVERGALGAEAAARARTLITPTVEDGPLAAADIAIEAVFEDMAAKHQVFARLDRVMTPGAVLASNTSTLDIDAIAAATSRPEAVIGTHFFSPANVMKLLEVVRGAATAPETIATVMGLAKTLGKVAVLAGNADGFIGNRILQRYGDEADLMLEEGATPWQVDEALIAFGLPMGVFRMRDLAGLDVARAIRRARLALGRPVPPGQSAIPDRLCDLGRFGQKTGAGFYRYQGREALPDPAVEALITAEGAARGRARRCLSDQEIVDRVLCAMVNSGAELLGEGIALRAGDIDVVYVHGYGFPVYRGGPMFWAEQQGLAAVLGKIREFHARFGAAWAPAPLLLARAAEGRWDPHPPQGR